MSTRPSQNTVDSKKALSSSGVNLLRGFSPFLHLVLRGLRQLRIEVVVHNVKDLRSGKVLDKLPELLKRMREMLVRFLGTVQAAHVAFLDEGAFERWSKPIA